MAKRIIQRKSSKSSVKSRVILTKNKNSKNTGQSFTSRQPVIIEGIEFDAMLSEDKTYNSKIPQYPVEGGFSVTDTIILEPMTLQMTLYITNTPVSFRHRNGTSKNRVNRVCELLENLWYSRKLVKVVTKDAIYTDMGITSISIKKSTNIGCAREVNIKLEKVKITNRKTTSIPDDILKSGATMANAGIVSISSADSYSEKSKTTSKSAEAATNLSRTNISSNSTEKPQKKGNTKATSSQKGKSILYGVASGIKLL